MMRVIDVCPLLDSHRRNRTVGYTLLLKSVHDVSGYEEYRTATARPFIGPCCEGRLKKQ